MVTEFRVNLRRHNRNMEIFHGTKEECVAFTLGYAYQETGIIPTINRHLVKILPDDGDYSHFLCVNPTTPPTEE